MTITIVGLGPGSIDDISRKAWRTIENAEVVYLRTRKHPCVPDLPQNPIYESFDHLYDLLEKFEDVYETIAQEIISAAHEGDVIYAVPGDPLVGESTVTYILSAAQEESIKVEIVNGISFIEPMLAQIGIDALDGLQIFDALTIADMHHPPLNPEYPVLLAQLYSQTVASNVKLTLMNQYPDEFIVKLIHAAGVDGMTVEEIPLYEIDHSAHIDVLTSLFIPPLGELTSFEAFQEVIAHLRAPEGCPWDRKQTHESLRPYLIEEAYEVLEAIDNADPQALYEELGDLLLQIVLHTQIAIDDGEFYMTDILRTLNQKMIRRHPHVWGSVDVNGDPDQVVTNWEDIKKAEKAKNGNESRKSILDGVPKGTPALFVAHKYQAKAAKVGFDWNTIDGVEDKVKEELEEILTAESDEQRIKEIGDLLFALVNWLRWLGVDDPETIMRDVNAKFYRRFRYIEEQVDQTGKILSDYSLDEMDKLWDEAKSKGL